MNIGDTTGLAAEVRKQLLQRKLAPPASAIAVAVSGGPDSMALLHLLAGFAAEFAWQLHVVHFNHCLRGRASDADERLVRNTARALGVSCAVESADVRAFARVEKLSVEMAARRLRHQFFARAAAAVGIQTVAVAHHADDQVELFFLRLLRGAGGQGMGGMRWQAPSPASPQLRIIRPLLGCTRAEIMRYVAGQEVRYRVDTSNQSHEHLRNRIRHELLPLLVRYQPGLARTIPRLMEIIGAESDYLDQAASKWLVKPGKGFDRLHPALQRRLMERQLLDLGVPPEYDLVERLREMPDRPITVASDIFLTRTPSGGLERVESKGLPAFDSDEVTVDLAQGQATFGNRKFRWQVCPRSSRKCGAEEWFDAEALGQRITLRHWRAGDRYQPIGATGSVKLQDAFVNAKVPRAERVRKVVATAADGRIFWVEGLRIAEAFKLTDRTRRVVHWQWG